MNVLEKKSKVTRLFEEAEFNRFGINSAILIIIGCLGGVAVGLGAIESTLALSFVVFPTMTTLSMILGVAPMRILLWSAVISVTINTFLIAFYAISSFL